MTKQEKEKIKSIEQYLDERWIIANEIGLRGLDKSFYSGCLRMLDMTGYTWLRDENGNHKVWQK